jgi:hypothetical protein
MRHTFNLPLFGDHQRSECSATETEQAGVAATPYTCIRVVSSWNPAILNGSCRGCPQSLHANVEIVPWKSPQFLPSKTMPIHHSWSSSHLGTRRMASKLSRIIKQPTF